jgi:two-component system sensor histidine kinase HupT/HoxJ
MNSLTSQISQFPANDEMSDNAWVEVIQRMDEIYADLVNQQVMIEEKNAALEEAHQFIESILASMHDVLVVADIDGNIQRVNHSIELLTQKKSRQLIGKPLTILFPPEAAPQVNEFPEYIRSGKLVDCEIDMLNSEQYPVPMAITCTARYHLDGRLLGSVLTGKPLDEIRRAYRELQKTHEELQAAQQQLIQSEKMASLGRLVAGVAHELNNPISFVYGNMYALQGYKKRFQQYIHAIHDNISLEERESLRQTLKIDYMLKDIDPLIDGSLEGAQRVSTIVQELKRFSTPKHNEITSFDLVQLIKNSIQWIVKSARTPPKIKTQLPEQLRVNANKGYIQQILLNLIQNALDAMEKTAKPCLKVCLTFDDEIISISIQDSGMGISEENLLSIFDPFFTTKEVGKGTGLGLYISYGLATEQCDGTLQVSNNSDDGANFILTLPLS